MEESRFSIALFTLGLLACAEPADTNQTESDSEDIGGIPSPSDWLEDTGFFDSGTTPDEDSDDDTPAEARDYGFDGGDSLLYIQVWKDQSAWGSGWAHDHVIRANNWSGTVSYSPDNLGDCDLYFEVPVDDFLVDEDAMRELVGLDGTISSSDRSTIKEHMLGSSQLNADSYDTIEFSSTSCQGATGTDGTLSVSGGLTIRGTRSNVTVDLSLALRGNALYLSGELEIAATDFGFDPYSAYAGAVRNMDEMTITIDLVGTAQ